MRSSSIAVLALVVSASLVGADDTPTSAKPVIIGAVEIASADLRAEEPVKNKWWLNRNAKDWGAPQDAILMTGKPKEDPIPKKTLEEWGVIPASYYVPYRVPELTIDPKVRGWHRIQVGLYHESKEVRARLWGKLTGEPYPEYLQTPDSTTTRAPRSTGRRRPDGQEDSPVATARADAAPGTRLAGRHQPYQTRADDRQGGRGCQT